MTFKLFPSQQEHVASLHAILEKSPFALDLSMLGTGKTYTASQIAFDLNVRHVVVIAPVSVLAKWKMMKREHDLPLTEAFSFQSLRGVKDKQPKHELLHRHDYYETVKVRGVEKQIEKVAYSATPRLETMVEQGMLLVIDEIQNTKNMGKQLLAASALIESIVRKGTKSSKGTKSRVLLLSGSPIDKEEHATNMFRMLGIMKSNEVCVYHPGGYKPGYYTYPGYDEIASYMRRLAPKLFNAHEYGTQSRNAAECRKVIYQMFQEVFKPTLSSAMQPQKAPVVLSKFNGMYTASDDDTDRIACAVSKLAKACRYNPEKKTVDFSHNGVQTMTAITAALMAIENAKLGMFERIVRQELEKNKKSKVVVCLNYSNSIEVLKTELAAYKPLILQGCMNQKQREAVIERFQRPDTSARLLITNLTVASTGIDLDDKHGGFPRTCFASPMFNSITLYQLSHRFQRMDTRSSAAIFMVYEKTFPELNILNALARKGGVMKETSYEQALAGVLFPCDYPEYVEN